MNFTITSSWVRLALPLSIFMLLITSLVGQTAQQAALVRDIRAGTASSNPTNFTSVGNIVYFTADDGTGSQLWKSDGTAAGTVKIGSFYSNPQGYNGKLYVLTKLARVTPDNDQVVLWSYNGSAFSVVDTVKRSLGVISAANLSLIGSKLAIGVNYYPSYSTPYSETKNVRYLSDGIAGTTRLSDYTYTKDGGCGIHSYTNHYLADTLAFYSDLTSTCGNPEPAYLYSVKKGLIWRSQVYQSYGLIKSYSTINNRLIFAAAANNNPPQNYSNLNLYSISIDGDSLLLKSNFAPSTGTLFTQPFQVFNNKIYIPDNDSRIWETDGTVSGTIMLTDGTTNTLPLSMNNPIALADGLYFYDTFNGEYRVWKIGTTGNIRKILSIPSATDKDIKLVNLNNELWQFASVNTSSATDKPVYLYKIDVVNGTRQSISVANGLDFGNNNFVSAGLKIFASANDGVATNANPMGQELYQLSIDPSVANCANDNVVPYFGYCPISTVKNITSDRDTAYYAFPSAFDNCSTPSVSVNITGALANNAVQTGNTVVIAKDSTARFEYTATDAKGNTAKCLFTVKVLKPCVSISSTFTSVCPRDTTIQTPDACTRVSWQVPTAVDNCGNAATVTQSSGLPSGSCFPLGVQTITYNKQFGGTCSFTITVTQPTVDPCITDIVKPVFTNCPQNINLTTVGTTAVATWTAPTATDNCTATPSVSSTHNSGFAFPVGTTAVAYTATDAKGNTATCSFNVVVTQTITTPSNCTSTSQAPWNEWIKEVRLGTFVNASDKIRTDRYAIGYSDFTDKIISVNKGQIYPFSISNGLSWSGSQVNLNYRVWIDYNRNNIFEDTEKAFESTGISLAAIGNITIPATATVGSTRMRVSMKKDAYPTACETFASGEVEDYTVQIIDATQVCSAPFWINIVSKTPTSVTLNWNRQPFSVSYDYEIRTSGVGGLGSLGLVRNSNTPDSIATIPLALGTYQIYLRSRCTTGESAWNTGMTFTISNDPCANDSQAPVFAGVPANITVSCGNNVPTTTNPTVSDNCSTISQINVVFQEIRTGLTIKRTWTATDLRGNTATATQTITISDNIAPVFTGCPQNISVTTTGACEVVPWNAPSSVSDNCGGAPNVTFTPAVGTCFPIGTHPVVYVATDDAGNQATCSFTITVSGNNTTGTCKKYTVSSTNSICNPATWQPYLLRIGADRYVADVAEFKETSAGTATLKGTLRSPTWQIVPIDLTFSGKTTTGTAQKINCLTPSVSTANWAYYTTVSGTIGLSLGTVTINTLSNALQIGTGANTQNINNLGGYAKLQNGTTTYDLAFNMTNETAVACETGSNTCTNNALNFDGNDDYLQTPQYFIPANSNFTIEASFTSTATTTGCQGEFKRLLALELSNSSNRLEIGDCAGQLTLFYFISGGNAKLLNIPNATTLRDGNFHHVAAVKTGDILTIYYDGVLVLTEAGLANINNVARELYVGRWAGGSSENWKGNVDEVRVWNYAVSATDITNRRNCQLSGTESGLILYFPFNQGVSGGVNTTITSVIDRSPSNITTPLSLFGMQGSTSNFVCSNQILTQGCTSTNPCATDVTPPVLTNCPANISLTTTGTTAIGTWTAPTATDNCTATPSVSSNFSSGFAFPIGTTTVIYTAKDALNNTKICSFTVTVTLQTTGGGTNDIGLTISATPSVYRQWTPITARVSAKNNGTTAMTNVKIELKRPAKTSSGGAKTVSLGVFNDYCAGGIECSEWVIPSLAAGATATLDAPFFVLDATLPIVITANLLASTPTDATTANNTASISIASATAAAPAIAQLAYQKPTQLIPIVVQRIAPNPTNGELIVKLESLDEREVVFEFFNTLGKLVKTEKRAVDKGVNRVEFEVSDLEQGVHFIVPSTTQGYKVPTKFVKM